MGKILYFECNSGISGDMTVGALLDSGADKEVLVKALDSLGISGYHLHFGRTVKCGLDAYDFNVGLEEEHAHDHGHHNHSHHEHGHDCKHEHEHHHEHQQQHPHRNIHDIYAIIEKLQTSERVKDMAKKMFDIVAEAESRAHGIPVDEVHFHEVGAIDSIVDIVGTAICIDNLGIEEVVVSPLAEGFGTVRCQHGVIPVPVPATANIASAHGLKLRFTDNMGEMVTPTGAAIAAALKTKENLPATFRILRTGLGAGKKDFKQANVLRAMIIEDSTREENTGEQAEQMWVLEANIDDSNGEALGFVMELLLEAGAADVWYTPIYMKKNRPAYMMSLICREEDIYSLESIMFTQTTTIGLRRYPVSRTILSREKRIINTELGEAEVKICRRGQRTFFYPEYESIRKICRKNDLDYQTVYYTIREEAERIWKKN
ncbi:nickel pincer cofactor biosynthesis protein LarC [Sedimentibacter hydroxybenzoicus DSM 7310]|uniref:Pyridinium-3,5-bisthiocarboxylic acid mononucleotide nickel insertion protein n=1 Tax=Sedimentibacter hydroxybenzoicus DSM 7310 TaxID=1123245 RepID=A0A974GVU9_SEDHY|nr:nickel pincer cofactor biosynthesis protein LarC [Sedimentibacter hydroxybenzoicus]NYB73764.1 nickel pincer cofactor biosynthesis protein LarC [Sedimentibacter hydroxybenzoicus DSM 7310]